MYARGCTERAGTRENEEERERKKGNRDTSDHGGDSPAHALLPQKLAHYEHEKKNIRTDPLCTNLPSRLTPLHPRPPVVVISSLQRFFLFFPFRSSLFLSDLCTRVYPRVYMCAPVPVTCVKFLVCVSVHARDGKRTSGTEMGKGWRASVGQRGKVEREAEEQGARRARHWSGRLSKWPRAQLTPPPTPLPPPPIPTLLFLLFGRPTRRLARKPPGALPHEICIIAMDYRDTRNVAEKFLTVCEPPLTIRTKRWRETDDVRVKRFTFFPPFFSSFFIKSIKWKNRIAMHVFLAMHVPRDALKSNMHKKNYFFLVTKK